MDQLRLKALLEIFERSLAQSPASQTLRRGEHDEVPEKSGVTSINLPSLERLLDDFRKLPRAEPHEPTLLEIAGWKGEELVASKILEFFLSPGREHNWGTLLLDALLSLIEWKGPSLDKDSVEVQREVTTENGNRLDLVIESNALVVGIENKITADPCANPFTDYMRHLKSLSGETDRGPLLVLLTPREVKCLTVRVPLNYVTYDRLLAAVEMRLRDGEIDEGSRYARYWSDFRETMRDFSEEVKVDEHLFKFIKGHADDLRCLSVQVEGLKDKMRRRTKAVKDEAEKLLNGRHKCIFWDWRQEAMKEIRRPPLPSRKWGRLLFDSCSVKLQIPDVAPFVYMQAALYFGAGWEIQVFATTTAAGLPQQPDRLRNWLASKGIETRPSDLMENLLAYGDSFREEENDLQKVGKQFCDFIDKVDQALANARPQ